MELKHWQKWQLFHRQSIKRNFIATARAVRITQNAETFTCQSLPFCPLPSAFCLLLSTYLLPRCIVQDVKLSDIDLLSIFFE